MTTATERDALAASITRQASSQTYYIIRFFIDRDRIQDAFRAYAYFRWVDNIIDGSDGDQEKKLAFAERQRALLNDLYLGISRPDISPEEELLQDLVWSDPSRDSGLYTYLDQMMAVMEFDAGRRGELITQDQLDSYADRLATAVTEAMHYFIGHGQDTPQGRNRNLAVTAAHITHMLRDALEDAREGYYNIPREILAAKGIAPSDTEARAYREWVCSRVKLARSYFRAGRYYLSRVSNLRCRLVGYAYTARFEWVLRVIERENFCLRLEYPERKSLPSALWMIWNTLRSYLNSPLWRKTYLTLPSSGSETGQT